MHGFAAKVLLAIVLYFCFLPIAQAQVVDVTKTALPESSPLQAQAPVEVAKIDGTAQWQFRSEQEWIVDSIGRDIAEILSYAKSLDKASADSAIKEVPFHSREVDHGAGTFVFSLADRAGKDLPAFKFTLTEYLWSTKNYEPYARQLLQNLGLTPQAVADAPADFLVKIANSDMPELIAENERVSRELSQHPLDACLHEQAAMLLSRFNLDEYANDFTEDRPQLSRGCVHLSIARALNNGKLGLVGRLADLSLEMMSVRDGVIMPRLDQLERETTDSTVLSVLRAFKIRATHDCRIFDEKTTPLSKKISIF